MSSLCPFAKSGTAAGLCLTKSDKSHHGGEVKADNKGGVCPVTGSNSGGIGEGGGNLWGVEVVEDHPVMPAKCPFGYESNTFNLGSHGCIVCQGGISLFKDTNLIKMSLAGGDEEIIGSRARPCLLGEKRFLVQQTMRDFHA